MNLDILKEWIEPVLNEKDCVLYDIEWLTNQNPPILQISVENKMEQWILIHVLCVVM